MKKPIHHVSDHAVVRYLERVQGVDVEALRREIGHKVDLAVQVGASGVVVEGFSYKLSGGVVTTVVRHNVPDQRTGRVRRERLE